jgi:cell division protease FtsH
MLDRALLRPGRFDRQVLVDAPDMNGRLAILKVHARGKRLADDVDLEKIARATPGFSGADLANTLNEAALLAARGGQSSIAHKDLEEAMEKVVAGPERKSRRMNEEEKRRVAYHEVGHALVSVHVGHKNPVHKISIIPRGTAALGYTLTLPQEDIFLHTREELLSEIKTKLGGRAAEEVVYGEAGTGASRDLEQATHLAEQMVCNYGMSEAVGLAHIGHLPPLFLRGIDAEANQRDCSPETSREVDLEVKKILQTSYAEAKRILSDKRDQLERVAQELLERESLDADTFYHLIGARRPSMDGSAARAPVAG